MAATHVARCMLCFLLITLFPTLPLAASPAERIVRVGAFSYYPAIFQDRDGSVKGFYVDTLEAVAKREHWKLQYIFGSWSDGLDRIRSGEVDLLTSVAYTEERATFMDYGKVPLLTVWGELYVPRQSPVVDIRDVRGKTVAVMSGDFNGKNFQNQMKSFDIPCTYREYASFDEVLQAVRDGKADAGVVNNTFGSAMSHNYQLKSSGFIFNPFDIHFAVAKGKNGDIMATLDRYLGAWRRVEKSPYHLARAKWGHGSAGMMPVLPNWLPYAVGAAVLLAGAAIFFIALLRYEIRRKTSSLRRSKEELELFFNLVPDLVCIASPQGHFQAVNTAWEKTLGYTRDELLQHPLIDFVHPEDRGKTQTEMQRQLGGEETMQLVNRYRGKDGTYRWLEWAASPALGGVLYAVARDITDRMKMEERLRHSQKMEAVGLLAGGVAHDLNNILQIVLGNAYLAKSKLDHAGAETHHVDQIASAVERGTTLTQGLLAFSRKQNLVVNLTDLNTIIRQSISLGRRLVEESVKLNHRLADEPLPVRADENLLQQVIFNLITNARDSLPGSGEITIRSWKEEVGSTFPESGVVFPSTRPAGWYAGIGVADNGTGIPPESLPNIFEPFFTTKEVGKGSGLGLAMVHGTVIQHGGFILVLSVPAGGSEFRVYLPLQEESEDCFTEVAVEKGVPGGRGTILVAEDDADVRKVVVAALSDAGYRVIDAEDGNRAVEIFRQRGGEIDCVLVDAIMPGLNGKETLDTIRCIRPEIPYLFLSGYSHQILSSHGVGNSYTVVAKPVRIPDLLVKVSELLK
ncbi:transporter substrate-binding domain-containing protein [Geobacter sp. DSM 9736]|uniref:PAS domain S-box protein n=1 Tax=Geobacter sp. DSM 9736 TaxID=1277350 RepID=UPI000B50A19E|nr:transporter substrate-binding domain-containing protein [Geobacter sp. DSM 9736]SNB45170.1 PAS domain S-box-containing protein [Geobacter sp. DSM 9736]